jgi:hypothetical protein
MKRVSSLLTVAILGVGLALPDSVVAQGELLLGSSAGQDQLTVIDRDTADSELIGRMNIPSDWAMNGLAFDRVNNILYGISPSADRIYTIDPTNAEVTPIGDIEALGFDNANGLAYDPNDRVLYATDLVTNTLFTVDTSTSVGTAIGPIGGGFRLVEGLAYDSTARILYGLADTLPGHVIVIDPATGDAVGLPNALPLDDDTWRGLTFDPVTDTLFASSDQKLYQVDPATGVGTLVGTLSPPIQGLAVIPEPATMGLLALGGLALLKRRK